jgi:diaminopimelate epimerase
MQGLGNDFVVIDAVRQRVELTRERARRLADRHFGIGCDQILVVEPASRPDVDFRYRIFNSDGGEVQQCGNGARCFVRFVREAGLTGKREIRVDTLGGVIAPRLEPDGMVSVDMGVPSFEPARVPFLSDSAALVQPLEAGGETVLITALSVGNPHAVQVVADVDRFPERVNAGYMQVLDRRTIRLRVWERGAGETLACGSGACAAVAAGVMRGLLDSPVRVGTRGGDLTLAWDGPGRPLWMTGPAETVFHGEIELQ